MVYLLTIKKEIYTKQKMAIRIIHGLKYNAHTEPVFKSSKILPFPDLIEFFSLQFMQRFRQNFLPSIFNDTWITNAIRREGQHQISLRNDNNLYSQPSRTAKIANHPLFSLPNKWDQLPPEINILRNKKEFDNALKLYFLNKLSDHVQCNNPLCPSCVLRIS
jgi:hypothetical protein